MLTGFPSKMHAASMREAPRLGKQRVAVVALTVGVDDV
jgi:hypothetical protein